MRYAVELAGVTKRYGSSVVLDRISAAMPEGEIIGLLGHNGAGKTTLIKLALGLVKASKGEVRVLGSAPVGAGARRLRAHIGYLPENVAFYGNFTGREVITYFAQLKHVPVREALALLDRVGLAAAAARPVRTYSKGMRQRLGLAQALLGAPELFFLDEPTTGLDPQATQQFFDLVRELRAQGRTVVISSHLLAELEQHLDRALIMRQGRLVAQGAVADMHAAAGLPDTILARFSDDGTEALNAPWLAGLALVQRCANGTFEIEVPAARKMEVMRRLVEIASLRDITVREPTLARLYATLGGGTKETAA
jgi:Cu-processing system ATP-binding protein